MAAIDHTPTQDRAASALLPGLMCHLKAIARPLAALVAAAHLALALQPLSAIAQDKGQAPAANPIAREQMQRLLTWDAKAREARHQSRHDEGAARRLDALLQQAHEQAGDLLAQQGQPAGQAAMQPAASAPAPKASTTPVFNPGTTPAQLLASLEAIAQATAAAREDLAAARQELLRQGASAPILARHDEAAAAFEQREQAFHGLQQRLARTPPMARSAAAMPHNDLQQLQTLLAQGTAQRPLTPGQPLPWRNPTATRRLPSDSQAQWEQRLHWLQQTDPAQQTPQARQKSQAPQTPQTRPGAIARQDHHTGTTTIAGPQFTTPPPAEEAPTPADLAETDETGLTDAIRAKARELGHNPVAIQNWVRNHIEWVPTWGAIQNADSVLASGRGNAFDIASLTIALLRASRIPARYQLGTIELPAAQAMNWAGGMAQPAAVQQLLGQGGIATHGVQAGGRISHIRLEHIWVSAYVNYAAGRGAVDGGDHLTPPQHPSPDAQLNAWIPLDASYKQYQYAKGMDLAAAVPLDAQSLLDAARKGATVNEAEGWVQNLNQAAIQNQLQQYQARLKTYIDGQNAQATVGDVIGKKIIPERQPATLSGQLPYPVIAESAPISRIPAGLQHRFTYTLSDEAGNPLLSYTEKTSQLIGKRLTLSYPAADQASEDLIASYLPKPHADGSPIQPGELPTSLPGYLIRLKPRISLDGQTVAQGTQALTMGKALTGQGGFTLYSNPMQWDLTNDSSHTAGQATAIGISAGGIHARQLDDLKNRLEQAKTQLQANNVQNLTGEQISGDLLTAVLWSWFAAAQSHNRLSQNQAGIVETPGLSYGLFHAVAQPVYSWGVVRRVEFPGVNMDIGHIRNLTWAKDNDKKKAIAYNRLRGQYMSALEHAVPERFFNDPAQCNLVGTEKPVAGLPNCPQGISAVKALGLAAAQGQKIYTITPEVYAANPNILNTALGAHSVDTRSRVQRALDSGMEVTIHQAPIVESGWKGAGFTSLDPTNGAGGYTIEGGSSGGWLYLAASALQSISGIAISMFFMATLAPIIAPYLAMVGITFIAPAISFWILAITIFITIAISEMASRLDVKNKEFDVYEKIMTIMTFLPSLGSRNGMLWLFVRGIVFMRA